MAFRRSDLPADLAPKYDDLVRRIYLEVWLPENAFKSGDTVATISGRLKKIASAAANFVKVKDAVSLDLLRAETVGAWVRSNMGPGFAGMNGLPGPERVRLNAPECVLAHPTRPQGNCDGYSRLTTALGSAVGVETIGIGGCYREVGGKIPPTTGDGDTVEDSLGTTDGTPL